MNCLRCCFIFLISVFISSCQWLPEISEVILSESSVSLNVGESITLVASVVPTAAEHGKITWKSSDPVVASVSNGVVRSFKAGTTQITASVDGVTSLPCVVTVKTTPVNPVNKVQLDKSSITIVEGETVTLRATVSPSDAINKSVTWSSSNTSVATVSASGVVTAKAAGSATITVKTNDGGKTATCSVTVSKKGNNISIPDSEFKSYLVRHYDVNRDGEISMTEALTITSLNVQDMNIVSLEGIEMMSKLEKLRCYSNKLASIDVSKNTALTELLCYSNQLTSLDVSKNTALTSLYCYSNQLTSLDVSKNTALISLSCYSNRITSLDVSNNKALNSLYCSPMEYDSLKYLYMAEGQSISTLDVPSYTKIVRK